MVWKKWVGAAVVVAALSYGMLPPRDAVAQVDNDPAANNTLTLEVTGIQKAEGRMACALFWQNKGFPRKHRRALRRTWVDVEGDTVRCVFTRTGLGEDAASVFVDLKDSDGLRAECQEAAWMGYTGKITIHPAQIDIVNEAFSPDPEEVDESRRLVAAFAEAEKEGLMAINFEGKMVDVPHLTRARKILARAEQIDAQLAGRA